MSVGIAFGYKKDSAYDSVKRKLAAACNLTALLLAPRSTRLECRKADVKHENYTEKKDIVDALVQREQRESMREKVF